MHHSLPNNIEEKLTKRARRVLDRAATTAQRYPSNVPEHGGKITLLHLMVAIVKQPGSIGSMILQSQDIDEDAIVRLMEKATPADRTTPSLQQPPTWSPELQAALTRAVNAASQLRHRLIGTEHLLYGAVSELDADNNDSEDSASSLSPATVQTIKDRLEEVLSSTVRFPDLAELFDFAEASDGGTDNDNDDDNDDDNDETRQRPSRPRRSDPRRPSPTARLRRRMQQRAQRNALPMGGRGGNDQRSAIEHFTEDLTEKAENELLDPLIGRDDEVQRLINILNRRVKNNPVLIGEPGVGKTAIVHGLAQCIAANDVPPSLARKRILALDLGLLVAGTVFRGEFEGRLKEVLQEAKDNDDIILFIDELHTIVGAGSAQGSLDAANMLKPALADGSIRVIGATTLEEYRKHIEKDTALERRFQSVTVKEQGPEETRHVMEGLKQLYEEHHNVIITDDAIAAAIQLSTRYMTERFLPDKAIDLLDETCSYVRSKRTDSEHFAKIHDAERRLRAATREKEEAIVNEDYDRALSAKQKEVNLQDLVQELKKAQREEEGTEQLTITSDDVEEIAATITGIPLRKLAKEDLARLSDLEDVMGEHIVGQHEAITSIARTLRRAHTGLADPNRPLGSFLFLGPTGVGKTETARILAREVFNRDDALIKIDMSEYLEPHSVARLIGAPPGYVGYEEEGMLTERVRRNPYSVILLDEIEKAHPKVYNLLLQVLEDGVLTSASGREVNFKNTIVIITSNIGTKAFTREASLGFRDNDDATIAREFQTIKNDALKDLRKRMTPELLNRIDHTIVFEPLSKTDIRAIVELQLRELVQRLGENEDIELTYTKGAISHLADAAWKPNEGARPVRQTLEREVEDRAAEKMVQGDATPNRIHVTTKGNDLLVQLKEK